MQSPGDVLQVSPEHGEQPKDLNAGEYEGEDVRGVGGQVAFGGQAGGEDNAGGYGSVGGEGGGELNLHAGAVIEGEGVCEEEPGGDGPDGVIGYAAGQGTEDWGEA